MKILIWEDDCVDPSVWNVTATIGGDSVDVAEAVTAQEAAAKAIKWAKDRRFLVSTIAISVHQDKEEGNE